jgi:hypothetical protein
VGWIVDFRANASNRIRGGSGMEKASTAATVTKKRLTSFTYISALAVLGVVVVAILIHLGKKGWTQKIKDRHSANDAMDRTLFVAKSKTFDQITREYVRDVHERLRELRTEDSFEICRCAPAFEYWAHVIGSALSRRLYWVNCAWYASAKDDVHPNRMHNDADRVARFLHIDANGRIAPYGDRKRCIVVHSETPSHSYLGADFYAEYMILRSHGTDRNMAFGCDRATHTRRNVSNGTEDYLRADSKAQEIKDPDAKETPLFTLVLCTMPENLWLR